MNAGQRDERVRHFAFTETTVDGRSSSGYAYANEYWAHVAAPSMSEVTVGGQGEHQVDAVFTFLRDVPVALGDVLKTRRDGLHYKITGIPPTTRRSNEKTVFAVHADDSTFAITGEPA